MERDAGEPSGFVAAPSQVPVNLSWEANVEIAWVAVGGKDVDGARVDTGEAQADRIKTKIKESEIRRMDGSIAQPVLILTVL